MLKIIKPSRARQEFEAVKGLARDSFNEFFMLVGLIAHFSLIVLATYVEGGELITFTAATLVVISGLFFALYWLGECKLIYPLRFKILYKRKKE